MRHFFFVSCVFPLLFCTAALAADPQLPFDSRPLVEVHSLESMPQDVIRLIGWPVGSPDGIAEHRDKFNWTGAPESNLARRLFMAAAVDSAAVVLIYQQAGRPSTYHALGYMMTSSGWRKAGEWNLDPDSARLRDFFYEFDTARYGDMARYHLEEKRRHRVEERIFLTRPTPRVGPLREANLSDNEAREIKSVMAHTYPGAILSISGVVSGCPCEEGPFCSSQAWVVPEDDVTTPGVLLSRIDGRWAVGLIQKWWSDRGKLAADSRLTRRQQADALDSQWKSFPVCAQTTRPLPEVKDTRLSAPMLHEIPVSIPDPFKP